MKQTSAVTSPADADAKWAPEFNTGTKVVTEKFPNPSVEDVGVRWLSWPEISKEETSAKAGKPLPEIVTYSPTLAVAGPMDMAAPRGGYSGNSGSNAMLNGAQAIIPPTSTTMSTLPGANPGTNVGTGNSPAVSVESTGDESTSTPCIVIVRIGENLENPVPLINMTVPGGPCPTSRVIRGGKAEASLVCRDADVGSTLGDGVNVAASTASIDVGFTAGATTGRPVETGVGPDAEPPFCSPADLPRKATTTPITAPTITIIPIPPKISSAQFLPCPVARAKTWRWTSCPSLETKNCSRPGDPENSPWGRTESVIT